jgi:hypothetical protein
MTMPLGSLRVKRLFNSFENHKSYGRSILDIKCVSFSLHCLFKTFFTGINIESFMHEMHT